MKKIFLHLLLIASTFLQTFYVGAQDTSHICISLLTCSPGEELYATFGHSALRIVDSSNATDVVYNFGTFNFDDEGFYLKFIKGQLRYYVNAERFEDFTFGYINENRIITEQELQLTQSEKININQALQENIKEQNKFYMYDFFFDNCTTRLRDIIVKFHQPAPQIPAVMPTAYTFRNAIHFYLDKNNKAWSKLGIDLLLGAPTDAVMTTAQQQFLPDNLMLGLDSTKNTQIILSKKKLYATDDVRLSKEVFTPLVCSLLLLSVFVALHFIKTTTAQHLLKALDAVLFFVVGLVGILLVLMWVATDHLMTKNNYNLLWAWPVQCVYAFFINKNTARVKTYSLLLCIFLFLLLCCWFFLAQKMNVAFLPLVVLLMWRSGIRSFKNSTLERV